MVKRSNMVKSLLFVLISGLLLLPVSPSHAGFTNGNVTGLVGVQYGAAAWGDYDNDGDLDLLLAGDTNSADGYITRVYRQKNDGSFEDIGANLPGITQGSVAWGDYDNDGDLDILISGRGQSVNITTVYNNENGAFTEFPFPTGGELPGLSNAAAAWGDYDRDGDLDIIINGNNGSTPLCYVYSYGNGGFTQAYTPSGAGSGSVDWGDFDKDGYLDFVQSGLTGGASSTSVFYNRRTGFQGVYQWTGIGYGSTIWGDYDSDGYLDALSIGYNFEPKSVSELYRQGIRYFEDVTPTNLNTALTAGVDYTRARAAWGDQDNDGDLDILVSGNNGTTGFGLVQIQDDTHTFGTYLTLPALHFGAVAWGDYDNDGDLDVFLTGADSSSAMVAYVYLNDAADTTVNQAPAAPTVFQAFSDVPGEVYLAWLPAVDDHTPAAGLTYNVRIGTAPGAADVLSPMSDLTGGQRRLPAWGNAGNNLFELCNYDWQTGVPYYWNVQAVDNNFAGSAWAEEGTFTVYPLNIDFLGTGSGEVILNNASSCIADCSRNYTGTVELTARSEGGNAFQWGGACSGNGDTCVVTMDQARNVTATFDTVPTYDLTLTIAGSGTGQAASDRISVHSGHVETQTYGYSAGSSVTINTLALSDSVFTGWSGDGCAGNDETCTITMDQDRSIIVTFDLATETFTLTAQSDGNGSGRIADSRNGINCGATCSGNFTAGTTAMVQARADLGSAFDGWSGVDCPGNGPCEFPMDENKTITATFNPDDDGDVISNRLEDAGPNNGDANNDGVPDSRQRHVATFPGINGEYVTIIASQGVINNLWFIPPEEDTEIDFPAGLFQYQVKGLTRGGPLQVTIRLFNTALPLMDTYYADLPNDETQTNEFHEFLKGDGPLGATITKADEYTEVVVYHQDGNTGDRDRNPTVITGRGGPSIRKTASGGGGGGSGCFINAAH